MDERLDRIVIKIERAEEHIRDLELAVKSFLNGPPPPYEVGTKADPQTGELIYHIVSIRPTPFKLAAITGDALQNLRSALDHLVCQLVLANRGKPTRYTSFPISLGAAKYVSPESRRKVEGVRQEAIKAIDALKPYKGGNDALWHLHQLNNIDKHRLIMTVGSTNRAHSATPATMENVRSRWEGSHPGVPFPPSVTGFAFFEPSRTLRFPLKAGDELLRLPIDSEPNKQMKFLFDIAFGESEVVQGQPLLETLHEMAKLVSGIVFSFRTML